MRFLLVKGEVQIVSGDNKQSLPHNDQELCSLHRNAGGRNAYAEDIMLSLLPLFSSEPLQLYVA